MPKTPKAVKREVVLLRRYLGEASAQRKAILGSAAVIGALWLLGYYSAAISSWLAPLVPSVIAPWLTRNRLIVLSLFAIISLAQYLAWRSATLKLLRLQREKTKTAVEAELDLKFGLSSNLSPVLRFEAASTRFQQLEKEIYSGDFSHSMEVAVFRVMFIPILQSWFAGGTGYPEWHARLVKLVETVSQHEKEQTADDWQ